jgi:cytochrome c
MRKLNSWVAIIVVIVFIFSGCEDSSPKVLKSETVKPLSKASASIDAAALFERCTKCHGRDGKKHALGTSNIIAGQSRYELVNKIKGYKSGTYGGSLKSVMSPQVQSLTPDQIEALSEYISKL